jgi:acyl-CoA reductase-like NAD-dependent aldehyde dehydrogenase
LVAKPAKFWKSPKQGNTKEMKMSSKPKTAEFHGASAHPGSEETQIQDLFNKQKAYFASDATKTYEWRIDQLDRLIRMLRENYEQFAQASCKDFKTASQESVFEVSASIATSEFAKSQLKEWMKPVEAPLPKFLAASGHKGGRVPGAVRRRFNHLPIQWTTGALVASGGGCALGGQPLHIEALRSAAGD